jgi:hypothetical protein
VAKLEARVLIQALDRKDRMLPLPPGRAESHGFESKRNGTLSLFAALNTTGEVLGTTAACHSSGQFVSSPGDVVGTQPQGREMDVICDNASSHKTESVEALLAGRAKCGSTARPPTRRGFTFKSVSNTPVGVALMRLPIVSVATLAAPVGAGRKRML